MARSTKIYLVYEIAETFPVAAFTVKHEAITYIKRTFSSTENIRLFSIPDGRSGQLTRLKIE